MRTQSKFVLGLIHQFRGSVTRPGVTAHDGSAIRIALVLLVVACTAAPLFAQPTIYRADAKKGNIVALRGDGSLQTLVVPGIKYALDLELDVANNKMYWTDINGGTVYRANMDASNPEIIWSGETNSFPSGIALDRTAGHVYWANDGFDFRGIQRANLDGTGQVNLIEGLLAGGAVAVDPGAGKLYWSDSGGNGTVIKKANLDGSAVAVIITIESASIDDMVLDIAGGKIYLTISASDDRIMRANLDGTSLETIAQSPDPQGITLDVAAGKVYWTDEDRQKFIRANLDGTEKEERGFTGVSGQGIDIDESTGKVYFLVSGSDFYIRRAENDGSGREDLMKGIGAPEAVTVDVEGGMIYWTSSGFSANGLWSAPLDGSEQPTELKSRLSSPEGIALDLASGKLYWSEQRDDVIMRSDLDGTNEETVLSGIAEPIGIALDVADEKIYWINDQDRQIHRAGLDGSNAEMIVDGDNSFNPKGIVLDTLNHKLYWTVENSGAERIQRSDLDGSNQEDVVGIGVGENPRGIVVDVDRGKVYWSTAEIGNGKLMRANLDGTSIEEIVSSGLGTPTGLAIDVTRRLTVGVDGTFAGKIELGVNYPNPFVAETTIPFELETAQHVRIDIFDILGRQTRTLVNAVKPAGAHTAVFSADGLVAGLYLYRLKADGKVVVGRMTLLE